MYCLNCQYRCPYKKIEIGPTSDRSLMWKVGEGRLEDLAHFLYNQAAFKKSREMFANNGFSWLKFGDIYHLKWNSLKRARMVAFIRVMNKIIVSAFPFVFQLNYRYELHIHPLGAVSAEIVRLR